MAMMINRDECTGCGDCEPVCPNGSITRRRGLYVIDPESCTECEESGDEPQCLLVCPVDDCILPLEE